MIFDFCLCRKRGFNVRVSCAKLTSTTVEDKAESYPTIHASVGVFHPSLNASFHSGHASLKFNVCGSRHLSSNAGASSTKDDGDESEDEFSELESPVAAGVDQDDLLSSDNESEGGEEPHDELELSDGETGEPAEKKKAYRKRIESELCNKIMDAPGMAIHTALDKWVEEGKEMSRQEISQAIFLLRKRNMYGRALQVIDQKTLFAFDLFILIFEVLMLRN